MNLRKLDTFAFTLLVTMTLVCSARPAQAIEGSTALSSIGQVGFTSSVNVGHLVTARSYMMQIAVGGTLRVSCPSTYTGTIEGQNALSQSVIKLPNVLTVSIPPGLHPTYRELPGFNAVPGGTTLTCGYYWTASARESGFTLGAPSGGIPIGNESYNAGDTVTFEMYKPGGGGGDDNGCIR